MGKITAMIEIKKTDCTRGMPQWKSMFNDWTEIDYIDIRTFDFKIFMISSNDVVYTELTDDLRKDLLCLKR